MRKGSFLKKCLSWLMAFAILLGVASPASAAIAALNEETYGYVAFGDAMTQGVGLNDPKTEAYYAKVAEHLGTEFTAVADRRYRIEEIRYLLDDDYAGDGYTASVGGLSADRNAGTVKEYVKNAEVISINVGVNNFSTYLISQMVYYLENQGAVKYEYDFDEFGDSDVQDAMKNVKNIVMDRLLAAAPDAMDDALELIEYVVEVSTYTYLSYMVSFNAVINEIYELNPDVELYIVGIYNAMAGEVLTVDTGSRTVEVPIGEAFGALVELANVYTQVLAPRAFDYIYVDPGTPELLIDVMGNTSIAPENRIPSALKLELLNSVEDTAISMIQEMFAQYGVAKTDDEAFAIAEEIFEKDSAARRDYIKSLIQEFAVDEVIGRFETELENYAGTYGEIDVTTDEIKTLLNNLEAATSESDRKDEATKFVVDLMTKAMVGQTFAGIKIETQDDAYEAIALLERNSQGDPDALREAAADMIMAKVGENGLKEFITRDDVLDLLEQMDTTTSDAQREVIIDEWMNDLAVKKITAKIQIINPNYKAEDAKALLAAMSGAPEDEREAIAKNHLLTTGGFHDYMVDKFEKTYTDNGLTLQTYGSFDAFVTAVEQAADTNAAKAIVRTEIRAAAAAKVVADSTCQNLMPSLTQNEVIGLFGGMDSAADADTYLFNWICEYFNEPNPNELQLEIIINPMKNVFMSAYNSYNNAATAAENAFAEYRDGVDTAAEGFAQYVSLKEAAAQQILDAYNQQYQGAGETALKYYADYLSLRDAAVEKVLNGYDEYDRAINLGLDTVDQFNETFDNVFDQLRAIAEVDKISLNHLVAVAQKLDANYVQNMVENLVQGDPLAAEDKTVAYIALRYYLANAMMIMPSAGGHATIANQIIKAIETGKSVNSTAGELANKVINTGADIYHAAKDFLSRPTNGSGQVETLKNPEVYVAFGDNVTSGTALSNPALAYPQLIGNALAMDYINEDLDTEDDIYNYALNGMRAEELLMLLDSTYSGDAYTEGRFGKDYIAGLRAEYIENVKNADLITINVGINNLTTFPIQQTLLAFNGEETYEMDWARYIGQSRYEKISKGKTAVMDLLLGIVDNAESRKPVLDDLNAYEKAERALETASTAIESLFYGLIGYVVNLDAAVEAAAALNSDATIVLIGFYNPLEGTYFNVDRTVEIKDHELDLSKYTIDVSALTDKVINLANRYLTNYVGYIADDVTAADEGSRIVSVPILNTQLGVTDTGASKDLSTLTTWKTVSVKGHEIDIMVPEYFLEAGKNVGVNLHPNATGHAYIASKVLEALDFEIHATVYLDSFVKYVGEQDPDFTYVIDDLSSLYGTPNVSISRQEGETPGVYEITATVVYDGYKTVTVSCGTLTIKELPVDLDPVCKNVRTGEVYEIVQLAVLDAVAGDTIEMLKDSDQTAADKLAKYHDAGTVNLLNGVTLDLKGFELTLDALYAAEGNYLTATHETAAGVGGRLNVAKDNLILSEGAVSYENSVLTTLPFWLPDEGAYAFGHFGIYDNNHGRGVEINVSGNYIRFQLKHRATSFLNQNYVYGDGATDNGLSVRIYLQWSVKDATGNVIGTSYQYFVFTDEMVSDTVTMPNIASQDYVYTLTNFSQLSIDPADLRVTAQVVSDTGAVVSGHTWDVNGIVNETADDTTDKSYTYSFTSASGAVFYNENQNTYYEMLHKAVQEADDGDTITMIGNSDQTKFTNVCPGAGVINLNKNIKLNLSNYILKLDALIVGEGSCVTATHETADGVGGRLIVPQENLILREGAVSYENSDLTTLPFWMPEDGYYVFGHFGIHDSNNEQRGVEINEAGNYVKFRLKHRSTRYLNQNYIKNNGASVHGLNVQIYLQWLVKDQNGGVIGTSYQYFVFNDEMVSVVTGAQDYVYTLTNFSQLSIEAEDLVVTASVVSSSGASVSGKSFTTENDKIQ